MRSSDQSRFQFRLLGRIAKAEQPELTARRTAPANQPSFLVKPCDTIRWTSEFSADPRE
jgi:hypothetical protein